jgi:hypothetical protein
LNLQVYVDAEINKKKGELILTITVASQRPLRYEFRFIAMMTSASGRSA